MYSHQVCCLCPLCDHNLINIIILWDLTLLDLLGVTAMAISKFPFSHHWAIRVDCLILLKTCCKKWHGADNETKMAVELNPSLGMVRNYMPYSLYISVSYRDSCHICWIYLGELPCTEYIHGKIHNVIFILYIFARLRDMIQCCSSIKLWCQNVFEVGSVNLCTVKKGMDDSVPDNKVHGANMGPTWVLSAPDGPHVGPMNLAIRGVMMTSYQ